MIGKPDWFKRRKYGGWGLYPAKWQGWVYIAAFVLFIFIFQSIPYWNVTTRIIVTCAFVLILLIDTIDIMFRLKKDEREKIHEAIAERNAMWIMVFVLAFGLAYQIAQSAVQQKLEFDWVIVIALVLALIVKAATNIYLDKKD